MANRNLFSNAGAAAPAADTRNKAGGRAYALAPKAALAQMAVTGVFNDTFYTDASSQLKTAKALVEQVEPMFLAKLAVYARQKAFMKDMPAYLVATLATKDVSLLNRVFDRVVDNGKMLRNFVQMIRSGETGRRSLGTRPKKLVGAWLNAANDAQLLAASVGNSPSLKEVIRLAHPAAAGDQRDAFFKYLLDREHDATKLPAAVQQLEDFRAGRSTELPKVPFELLTSMDLSNADWTGVARNATWTQTRMNLNTFLRHGVFGSQEMVDLVANRLRNADLIAKANVFPYQMLAAYVNVDGAMPRKIVNALQDAMELAVANVPTFEVDVAVCVDTSHSMRNSVTGSRPGATSKVRCIDVAALVASAIMRRNPDADIVPFDTQVRNVDLNGRDAIMTNAEKLAAVRGGGTNCSCALADLNRRGSRAQLVVFASDNESWADVNGRRASKATALMEEWKVYKRRNPRAKLVCIDVTPDTTSQAKEQHDVLNIGGFSDAVFNTIALFAENKLTADHWVGEIEKVVV
jgi:60 kDa SS-A/Ro ribonucleoprotein